MTADAARTWRTCAANAAAGAFYCPADRKVCIDLNFFRKQVDRFGGPDDATRVGSFAQAYAGVWAHYEQDRLDAGDIDSALPAQRQRWFHNGFANGQPRDCDTFSALNL